MVGAAHKFTSLTVGDRPDPRALNAAGFHLFFGGGHIEVEIADRPVLPNHSTPQAARRFSTARTAGGACHGLSSTSCGPTYAPTTTTWRRGVAHIPQTMLVGDRPAPKAHETPIQNMTPYDA